MNKPEPERTGADNSDPVSPEEIALEQSALERFLKRCPDPMKASAEPPVPVKFVR